MSIEAGASVVVCKPIAFGGGISTLGGRTGTVKKLLSARACMVLLDGESEPLMFFLKELAHVDSIC